MTSTAPRALTALQRHLYACGLFGCNLLGMVITGWCLKFYFPDETGAANLVPAGWAGFILLVGRLSDGLNDPFEGWISDRSRTPWGRRKPFMLAGLPVMLTLFLLVWSPPEAVESTRNFWWGALLLVFFFIGFTLYIGPYIALLPEVAPDPAERVRLSGLQSIYGLLGLIAGQLVPALAFGAGLGYREMAAVAAAVSLPSLLGPLVGPRDRPELVAGQITPPFFQSVAITLRNRPFQRYVLAHLMFQTGVLTIVSAMPYLVPQQLGRDKSFAGHLTGVALISGILCVPLVLRLVRRHGLCWGYRFSMAWFAGTSLLLVLFGPLGRTAAGLPAAFVIVLLIGVAVGGLYALPHALIGDICAHDWRHTGLHRQGMYFCVQGLILKLAYSLAPWLVDQLNAHLPAGALLLVGPLAAVLALLGAWWFGGFPEAEVREATAALQAAQAGEVTGDG